MCPRGWVKWLPRWRGVDKLFQRAKHFQNEDKHYCHIYTSMLK